MKNIFLIMAALTVFVSCKKNQEINSFKSNDWLLSGNATVEDGTLVLKGADARSSFSGGNFRNFELNVEVQTVNSGKGAIWFHSDAERNKGYKVSINNGLNDPVWWKMTGSLVSVRNLTKSLVKDGEWFNLKIKVLDKEIVVVLNSDTVVDYVEPEKTYRIEAHKNALLSEGVFAFESAEGEIRFRNITVKGLEAKNLPAYSAETVDEQTDEIIRLHQEDFPVLDYHVHLKGGLTMEGAANQSRAWGINYALAPNCGIGFPITNDQQVVDYLDSMRSKPFILAMQAEGREWVTTFSPQVRAEFDYVFTDALTFTDNKGRRTRLWIPAETWIENEQQYMDLIVDRICMVLKEPFDIYVNPCFLPSPMDQRYDEFWTEQRMDKFVKALAKSGKALEINDRYKIPNQAIVQKAKEAGVKFTFGTNNGGNDLGKLAYCIALKKACNITAADMYKPNLKH